MKPSEKTKIMENNIGKTSSDAERTSLPQYSIQGEELVKVDTYVLNIAGCERNSQVKIACSTTDDTVSVYTLNESIHKLTERKASEDKVTCLRFTPQKDNQLCLSSTNGSVELWDLRTGNHQVKKFIDSSNKGKEEKPILNFDISCDGRFICAGTEVAGGDAFLLFWDVRSTKLLGGYWESHMEDITQVVFHPTKSSHLITGAMDGLINMFDIRQTCEDDALLTSLNTESSVERLSWFDSSSGEDDISCLTHPAELQMWKESGCKPYAQFSREDIASAVGLKCPDSLYAVNVHHHQITNNLMLLTGSNTGNGDWFRSAVIKDDSLQSVSQFIGNNQIVRSSWYEGKNDILITGGEKGVINVWKPQSDVPKPTSTTINISSKKNAKLKNTRVKPY